MDTSGIVGCSVGVVTAMPSLPGPSGKLTAVPPEEFEGVAEGDEVNVGIADGKSDGIVDGRSEGNADDVEEFWVGAGEIGTGVGFDIGDAEGAAVALPGCCNNSVKFHLGPM